MLQSWSAISNLMNEDSKTGGLILLDTSIIISSHPTSTLNNVFRINYYEMTELPPVFSVYLPNMT